MAHFLEHLEYKIVEKEGSLGHRCYQNMIAKEEQSYGKENLMDERASKHAEQKITSHYFVEEGENWAYCYVGYIGIDIE